MYCEMCGAENDDKAKKCKKCGFSFVASAKNSREDFDKKTNKFVEDNAETIRHKNVVEVGVNSTKKLVKKTPIGIKIAVILGICVAVGLGIWYYIMTNNFFTKEIDSKTGEPYYVYYKNSYKVIDAPLFLRGKNYRVDHDGRRIENAFFYDENGCAYYYDADGVLQENKWFEYAGEKMHAGDDGVVTINGWADDYYLNSEGKIAKNCALVDHYFDENGKYLINTWKDDHYYGEDGVMYKRKVTPDGKKVDRYGDIIVDPTSQVFVKNFRFGSVITFGEFEQDGDESNGPEPIEWYLLHGQHDEAYLISKNVLFTAPYQSEQFANAEKNDWNSSYLKQWLEGYFYKKAFDDIDKKYILDNDAGLVFVPSVKELELYLPNQYYRMCAPTFVAKESTKFADAVKSFSTYWLRDNGVNAMHKKFVSDTGEIISDDVSKEVALTNDDFSLSVSDFSSSDSSTLQDALIKKAAKYLVGQIPIVGDLINESGITDEALEKLGESIANQSGIVDKINSSNIIGSNIGSNNVGPGFSPEFEKELQSIAQSNLAPLSFVEPEKKKIANPYLDVGKVTNEFMGVRPMLKLDMQANKQ